MKSLRVTNVEKYLSPDAPTWRDIEENEVSLLATPLDMQPTEYIRNSWNGRPYGETTSLRAASVHDGETWAIRVRWLGVAPEGHDFPDALAVALPVSGSPILALMGDASSPIHYLRWQANKDGFRSIIATGLGRSAKGPALKGTATPVRGEGKASLVISRPLGAGSNVAPLHAGKSTQIGFAVWQGSNDERAGIKAFSVDWIDLVLDA